MGLRALQCPSSSKTLVDETKPRKRKIAVADTKHYDLIVIGSGPGGYVGAIRAAQLGMKVACVERDKLGGVCLNWGCIPSKALLHNAQLVDEAVNHGKEWGINFTGAKIDFKTVIGRSRDLTKQLNAGIAFLFKKNKVDYIAGHAHILSGNDGSSPCQVEVKKVTGDYYHGDGADVTETITGDKIMIATGAAPKELPFAKCDGKTIVSSYDAMNLPKQPDSIVIVGSGAIGMEFAYFYNCLGTKVTVIEMVDRILPIEDTDVSKIAQKLFSAQGIEFRTNHTVRAVKKSGKGQKVTIGPMDDEKKSEDLQADVVLVAVGVGGRFEGLFDESLGIAVDRGHIKTDYQDAEEPTYQTSVPGIYAIGDIIGPPWLAHVASEEAVTCVERIAGHHTLGVDYKAIPGCTYCNPQIASIGMTERAVKEAGLEYTAGTYSLKAHGRAIAVGANEGIVKIIASKPYGEILGAHVIGETASELISEISLAIRLEATADDIISTMHPHPTMAEAIHEGALATEGRMIHN